MGFGVLSREMFFNLEFNRSENKVSPIQSSIHIPWGLFTRFSWGERDREKRIFHNISAQERERERERDKKRESKRDIRKRERERDSKKRERERDSKRKELERK